jgi:hypothetical protein
MTTTKNYSGLVQLHWQNRNDLSQTRMIEQNEFLRRSSSGLLTDSEGRSLTTWVAEVMSKNPIEDEQQWCWLLCEWDSLRFVKMAAITTTEE